MSKYLKKRLAVVSMIEIMMVFAVIGIVSAAAMGLSKPKAEYMKKIQLYTAYVTLQNAASQIAAEGHLDFTTDVAGEDCQSRYRNATHVCNRYTNSLPGMSYTLPKVAFRNVTAGANDTGYTITSYASLSAQEKVLYINLQKGFCERLAQILQIGDYSTSCSPSIGTTAPTSSTNFASYTPQLRLPNGQEYYIMNGVFTRGPGHAEHTVVNNTTRTSSEFFENFDDFIDAPEVTYGFNLSNTTNTYFNMALTYPWELRYEHVDYISYFLNEFGNWDSNVRATDTNKKNYAYYKKYLEKNKDYFIVLVDINGKMKNSSDTQNGPDKLGTDIFLFEVFRDGTVRPGYEYGNFPLNLLTAKIVKKTQITTTNGLTSYYYVPVGNNPAYASKPLGYASCYAGIAGDVTYKELNGTDSDFTSYTTKFCDGIKPLAACLEGGQGICKVLINEPSFFVR